MKRELRALSCAVAFLGCLLAPGALARPTPRTWHAPAWWLTQALCIHSHEGSWTSETGNGYSGGMQFTAYTWASVGGTGRASQQPPREQLYRAWLVYLRDGHSWREWGTAGMCGLR